MLGASFFKAKNRSHIGIVREKLIISRNGKVGVKAEEKMEGK